MINIILTTKSTGPLAIRSHVPWICLTLSISCPVPTSVVRIATNW